MAEDISRRIDDLLGGAIDEQVREQRALNDMMVGVRDGVSRLVGDVAALSARVTESRETSQGLREELPFLVQREVGTAVNAMSIRIDVLETAVGELVASLAGLEDRVGPDVIIGGIAARIESWRATEEDQAGAVTASQAQASIESATETMLSAFDQVSSSNKELLEKNYGQINKRLGEVKKWADEVEGRMRALEKALEANLKMPADVRKQLNELTGATQDMTDSVVEEIRINAEAGASRISQSVEGIDGQALEMNRRFAEMSDRIADFQEQVLAYLHVRDIALEERRDQIVTELLADFMNELPIKERERASGRLRSVLNRRRDKRDAQRYRAGSTSPPRTPPVSQESIDRAQAEMQKHDRLTERPWAERSFVEAASPPATFPAAVDHENEVSQPSEAEYGYESLETDLPVAPSRPKSKSKTPAKKKSVRSSPAKKKPAKPARPETLEHLPEPEGNDFPESQDPDAASSHDLPEPEISFEGPLDQEILEEIQAPAAEVMEAGEIDVVEMQPFAHEGFDETFTEPETVQEDEELTPRKTQTAKSKAPAKKTAAKAAKPSPPKAAGKPPAVQAEPDEAAKVQPEQQSDVGDDTLSQALARVQALVDQHRKPGSARKTKR